MVQKNYAGSIALPRARRLIRARGAASHKIADREINAHSAPGIAEGMPTVEADGAQLRRVGNAVIRNLAAA